MLNGWETTKRMRSNCKIIVKTFTGTTVSCIEDYMKLFLTNLSDHFILNVGTNDLSSEKSSAEIAESIIWHVDWKFMTSVFQQLFWELVTEKINERGMEVNLQLKELSKENYFLIDNSRNIKAQQVNKGKLHWTKYGSRV